MLERTRSFFGTDLSKDFAYIHQRRDIVELDTKRSSRRQSAKAQSAKSDEGKPPIKQAEACNMTRRTRTRRPRIPTIQSGYCAVCSVPYNSVQDHITSKKHQKLIGEDANYIALNGSLNGFLQNDALPFLNLNGVDAIGVHDSSFDEFSPKYKRRTMPRTRACSVLSDAGKSAPDMARLRSRKNINYMSPPSDDDSMQEQENPGDEAAGNDYKEYRELRSTTKAFQKLTEPAIPSSAEQEVWNSGRPKRACINKKRPSTDDYVTPNTKTFYKVEVVSSKSNAKPSREPAKRPRSQSPKRDEDKKKEKALIVKFKKMRNSELVRLNDEATNFLFPQKDDSESDSDEGEEEEEDEDASEEGESERLSGSDVGDDDADSFKVEDDGSMDSTSSSTKGKKKRRTHAEAFIMDNQKYYKFETPGSRLRYHGSYLPAVPKCPKFNGAFSPKPPEEAKPEEPKEKKIKYNPNAKVRLDKYKFSFEKVPRKAPWYGTFRRIDRGEQTYIEFSDYFFDPFLLPYQMPTIPPLDPRACLHHYSQLRNCLCSAASSKSESRSSTPDASVTGSAPSSYRPDDDDDSKLSVTTASSRGDSTEEDDGGAGRDVKNPRKSPRQHASTLAILSGLVQQRRRRARNKLDRSLPAIPEEAAVAAPEQQPEEKAAPEQGTEKALPGEDEERKKRERKAKPRIDYYAIARQIDKELDNALDDSLETYDLDVAMEHAVDFHHSKTSLAEILRLYDDDQAKESGQSCRRFLNGAPGRKPGRRKKTNRTGWPNRSARKAATKRDAVKDESESDESETESEDGPLEDKKDAAAKVLMNRETNSELQFQPYVCVQKLVDASVAKETDASVAKEVDAAPPPKRTKRKLRHMPGSPKSPRMLRKPRGRWYRER